MVFVKELWKVAIVSSATSTLVLLGGYLVLAQTGSWSEPTASPPGNNALAPLNAGPTGQSKSGGLVLNTGGAPNGLIVNSGATSLGGQLSMNNNKITNLTAPTDTADAVNLGYLQSYVSAQTSGAASGLKIVRSSYINQYPVDCGEGWIVIACGASVGFSGDLDSRLRAASKALYRNEALNAFGITENGLLIGNRQCTTTGIPGFGGAADAIVALCAKQ